MNPESESGSGYFVLSILLMLLMAVVIIDDVNQRRKYSEAQQELKESGSSKEGLLNAYVNQQKLIYYLTNKTYQGKFIVKMIGNGVLAGELDNKSYGVFCTADVLDSTNTSKWNCWEGVVKDDIFNKPRAT